MKTRLLSAFAAAMLLAACDRSPPPQPEADPYNDSINADMPAEAEPAPAPEPINEPAPVPVETTATVDTPPSAEPVKPDDQMMEDAEATGMTARVARDTETASDTSGDNETAPVEVEKK